MPYFDRLSEAVFTPTEHVGGAWNLDEQHVAPSMGLLTHLIETDCAHRRDDQMVLTRLSYDILGTLSMDEITATVRVIRPGRTIELVEAVVTQQERPALLLRAWLMRQADTIELAGTALPGIESATTMPAWDPSSVWPGGFIASAHVRRNEEQAGRARYWVRTDVALLDEPVSSTAAAVGLLDIANGMTVLADPSDVAFPNIDLTAHLFRAPHAGWLGFDTTVTFGPGGHGLTSSILHDEAGPIGTLAQTLTVRPSAA